jgi:hypothetical protein
MMKMYLQKVGYVTSKKIIFCWCLESRTKMSRIRTLEQSNKMRESKQVLPSLDGVGSPLVAVEG